MSLKLESEGQSVICSLIGIAVERISATGFAGVLGLACEPFGDEDLMKIRDYERVNPAWAESFMDSEAYFVHSFHASVRGNVGEYFDSESGIFSFEIVKRAFLMPSAKKDFELASAYLTFFKDTADFEKSLFSWKDMREINKPAGLLIVPDFSNAYARLVTANVQWRILLASDMVLRYRKANGMLPGAVSDLEGEWPVDSFNDEPLKYIKNDENSFTVYSVGPDLKDGKGEKLYVGGIMNLNNDFDIGFKYAIPEQI